MVGLMAEAIGDSPERHTEGPAACPAPQALGWNPFSWPAPQVVARGRRGPVSGAQPMPQDLFEGARRAAGPHLARG
jgi:hypothetical protein